MSTRTKLWIYFVISSLLSIVLFAATMLLYAANFNPGYSVKTFWNLRSEIVEGIDQGLAGDLAGIGRLLEETAGHYPGIRLDFLRADGSIAYSTAGRTEPYTADEVIAAFADMPYNLWTEDQQVAVAHTVEWQGAPHYLLLSLPAELVKDAQLYIYVRETRTLYDLGIALLIFLLTPLLFIYIFLFNVNRRLRRLNRAMNRMDIHGTPAPVIDRSKDEIGQLSRRFNQMATRINEQLHEIEVFRSTRDALISNLSHDLRTPLTMIVGYAETIQSAPPDEQRSRLRHYASIILQRSRYMTQLLERLLDVSRLQRGGFDPVLKETNLSELLRQITSGYVLLVEEKGIAFEIEIPETDVKLAIDRELVERAVRNLIDNALAYGGAGGYLGLVLEVRPDRVQIRVTDKGPGVAPQEQEHIFERFHRGDASQHRQGSGLGLAIVKRAAEVHQGTVNCTSVPGDETVFCLELSRTAPQDKPLRDAS